MARLRLLKVIFTILTFVIITNCVDNKPYKYAGIVPHQYYNDPSMNYNCYTPYNIDSNVLPKQKTGNYYNRKSQYPAY